MTRASNDGSIIVGLMSGTSLDGISAAVVHFTDTAGSVEATLLHGTQHGYDDAARRRLLDATVGGSARDYCRLAADLGDWLADAALDAMSGAGLLAAEVSAIASHGQTLWHEPGHSTWQIGDAARLSERTGCAVVSDFRLRDVAVGGQGAPLVSMADLLLFAHHTEWRTLQNIGGIANVTIVPPTVSRLSVPSDSAGVRAFDTGPGVVVADGVTQRLFGRRYDRNGEIAAEGRILGEVVSELLDLPYLAVSPPKTTGREMFTSTFVDGFIVRCLASGGTSADVVATACAFTAATIADQYVRWIHEAPRDVVISGGGARNPFLVRCISEALTSSYERHGRLTPAVRLFDDLFFDAESKEAVAFALLGYLHLTGRPGNVPGATGARVPRVLGTLTPAART